MRVAHLSLAALVLLPACSGAIAAPPAPAPAAPAAPAAPTPPAAKPAPAPAAAAPSAAPSPGAPPAAPTAKTPASPVGPPPMPAKLSVLEEARKRVLTKDDFVESDTNRDPFRSFLRSFASTVVINKDHKIILEKLAIDELRLAGIVTGELQPRAMFIDPNGQGVTIVRGDHISKADALVTRIAPDRVYLRIEEDTGTDKPRITERVIELHSGELTGQ